MTNVSNQPSEQPFAFTFIEPFKTFHNGQPKPIPYIIDGLLTQGGLSALKAIETLKEAGVIPVTGKRQSPGDPTLRLNPEPFCYVRLHHQ